MGYDGYLSLTSSRKSMEGQNLPYLFLRGQPLKVAPYSFSAREEWELNWHKRAREERDSPSQMTCANQPPR